MIFKAVEKENGKVSLGTSFGGIKGLKGLFKKQNILSNSDMDAIKAYNNEFVRLSDKVNNSGTNISRSTIAKKAADRTMASASATAQDIVAKAAGNTVDTGSLVKSSKAAAMGMKAVAAIGNSIVGVGIDMAVQSMISGIDYLIHKKERDAAALENAETATEKHKNALSSAQQKNEINTSTANKIAEEYAAYAQGVNTNNNKNISLTNSDYEEFLNLNNQLAELFPSLTKGYDENGNAILGLGGNIETVKNRIAELIETQNQLAKAEIKDHLQKYVEGDTETDGKLSIIEDYSEEYKNAEEKRKKYQNFYKLFSDGKISSQELGIGEMDDIFGKAGLDMNSYSLVKGNWDITNLDKNDLEKVKQTFENNYFDLVESADAAKLKLENANQELSGQMMYWVADLPVYTQGGETYQKAISTMISSIKWDDNNVNNLDEAKALIQKKVLTPISMILDDPNSKEQMTSALSNLYAADFSNMPIADSEKAIDNYLTTIMNLLNSKISNQSQKISLSDMYTMFGMENYKNPEEKLRSNLSSIANGDTSEMKKLSDYTKNFTFSQQQAWLTATNGAKTAEEAIKKYQDSIQSTKSNQSPQSFSESWKSLKSEEREKLLNLSKSGKLTPDVLSDSKKYASLLESVGNNADTAAKKINSMVESSDQLAAMKAGIKSISNVLGEKQQNLSNKETRTKGIEADTLAGFDAEIKGLDSWDEFEKTLGNGKSSMKDCQKAANKLATEWVNSNDFLSQLDETHKDYYISTLKQMGVKNAEAVVTSRLNNEVKESKLAKEIAISAGKDFNDMTLSEIVSQNKYKTASENARIALLRFYLQENILNNSKLDMSQKIQALKDFIKEIDKAKFKSIDLKGDKIFNKTMSTELAKSNGMNISKATKKAQKKKESYLEKKAKELTQQNPEIEGELGDTGNSGKQNTAKEPKQEINWMDRKVTALNNKLSETQKLYNAIAATMKKADSSAMVKKENANLNKQIRTLRTLRSAYGRQASKYQSKANKFAKKNLSKDLQNKVKNGKIKGTYSELVAQYGEPKAKQIQKAIDLYDKASTARQNKADVNKQINDAKIQKYQNRADLAQSRIDKNAARAELEPLSKKNKYIDNEITHTRALYKYQIKIARRNGDNEEVAKLKAERGKKIRDYKVEKHQNRADLAQSRIDKNAARAELVHLSKKNKYIDKEIEYTQTLYKHKIEIAKLNGDKEEAAKLEAECKKTVRDLEVEKLQNLADENEASYNLKATEASMTTDYRKKNQLSREGTASLKKQYQYLMDIAEKEGDITEKKRLQLEMAEKLNEDSKERVQNVIDDYENRLIGNNRQMQVWNNAASLAEAKGYTVSAKFYDKMAETAEGSAGKHKEGLDKAWGQYYQEMELHKDDPGFFDSQQWYDIIKAINSEADAWEQDRISAEKYKQQAIEAHWEIADSAKQAIDYLNDEAETYKSILGYSDMYDKNGVLTDAGTATFALDVYGIENNIEQFKKINEEIDELNELFKAGKISPEVYNKRMQELRDNAMSTVESIYSIRDSMKSLIEDGLNAEMDALNESIDKVKQNLSDASSLREYQKNIEKQTKNIASLERQISARSGDMSEKGRADVQKLKVQLEDAKSELEDTEYDKYVEDQERILDNMSDDFQKYLDGQLKQIDELLNNISTSIQNGEVNILPILEKLGDTIGVDLSKVSSGNLAGFASTGKTDAGSVYENTKETYENSANEEFNQGANTPVMNTDEHKGQMELNALANDPAYQKSSAWLKSKGFSDNDVNRMYTSLGAGNAQALFTNIQSAASSTATASTIFNSYSKEIAKAQDAGKETPDAFSSYMETDAYATMEDRKNKTRRMLSNFDKVSEIAKIFATVRPYENDKEYSTGTRFNYGAQRFAEENGEGYNKYLSMENVKRIDDLVKEIVNIETGEPAYNTSNGEHIYAAIVDLDKHNFGQFTNAIKTRTSNWNVGGFSKGGIIDSKTMSKIADKNGDDAWVTVKSGEGILTPIDTQNLLALTDTYGKLNSGRLLTTENIMSRRGVSANNNVYGGVNIHLDGSDIKDFATFETAFQNAAKKSPKLRNTILDVATSGMTGDTNAFMRR